MQQVIRTANGPIQCTIKLPGSRSMSSRAILIAALADGVSELTGIYINDQIRIILNALYQLGIIVQLDETTQSCIIAGCNGQFPKKQAAIACGDDKTALRFLLTACAATPGVYYFDGTPSLQARSLIKLIRILFRQGAQFIPNDVQKLPLTLVGADTLEGGDMFFNKHIHSQMISAMLMVSPFARSPFNFTLLDIAPYSSIDLTIALMSEFGVLTHRIHHGQFMVPVPQRYQAKDFHIEPDLNFAIYFFAAAAITGGQITIPQINRARSKQGALRFLQVLIKMGCKITQTSRGLTVQGPRTLQGIIVKMRSVSDSFLALMVLAVFAKSPTHILHVRKLHHAEMLRLDAMTNALISLGIQVERNTTGVKIIPDIPKGRIVSAKNDYRQAMALALIGLRLDGFMIEDDTNLNTIFPEFYTLWARLTKPLDTSLQTNHSREWH